MYKKSVKNPLVSIVFPIKYWSKAVDEFYRMINNQVIDCTYEIVAVYSGEDDKIYKKIKSQSTIVKRIPSKDYKCGDTRELTCSLSTGQYIVMVSVDVIPTSEFWLRNIVKPLVDNEADVVQGKLECPSRTNLNYPNYFFWEKDYGFYFTSEGLEFYKKYGNFGKFGNFGLAAPNLAFKRDVWENTGFGGVSYNEDNIFQKRVALKKYKVVYKDDASVFHAHTYKTMRSLFDRCSNEGYGWFEIGERYNMLSMIRDVFNIDMYRKTMLGLFRGEIKYPSELFFVFIRPIGLYWGNHFAKMLYDESR